MNSTTVWEHGGGYYGLPSGGSLDGFADLVEATLGPREGAVAMMSLASPTGYLNLAQDAITGASKVGKSSVDNVPVTEYEVTVEAARGWSTDPT